MSRVGGQRDGLRSGVAQRGGAYKHVLFSGDLPIEFIELERKMAAAPGVVWTRLLGGLGDDYASSLTVGLDGAIYVVGDAAAKLDGIGQVIGAGDPFIARLNPDRRVSR